MRTHLTGHAPLATPSSHQRPLPPAFTPPHIHSATHRPTSTKARPTAIPTKKPRPPPLPVPHCPHGARKARRRSGDAREELAGKGTKTSRHGHVPPQAQARSAATRRERWGSRRVEAVVALAATAAATSRQTQQDPKRHGRTRRRVHRPPTPTGGGGKRAGGGEGCPQHLAVQTPREVSSRLVAR